MAALARGSRRGLQRLPFFLPDNISLQFASASVNQLLRSPSPSTPPAQHFSNSAPSQSKESSKAEKKNSVDPTTYYVEAEMGAVGTKVGAGEGVQGGIDSDPMTYYVEADRGATKGPASEKVRSSSERVAKAGVPGVPGGLDEESKKEEKAADAKTRVLDAALSHVVTLGWTEDALAAGARDEGLSPSILGMFPRGPAHLVEHYIEECTAKMEEELAPRAEELAHLGLKERLAMVIQTRLEVQAKVASSWPQALSLQVQPQNIPHTLRQRADLIGRLWEAAGERSGKQVPYTKQAFLAAVYGATELYMLTDFSPGFEETWKFLKRRLDEGTELRKSTQELTQLASTIGAGLSRTVSSMLQGSSTRR